MGMDGFNFSRINPDYSTNRNDPQQSARIIDIVLLDTTSYSYGGMAYQLLKDISFTEDELRDIKKGLYHLPQTPFSPLGEVKEVKSKSKQLILTDRNTVQYSHLVIVKGTQPSLMSYEFLAAFYTLVDALRLQKWVPEAMLPPPHLQPKVDITASESRDENLWIDHLPPHHQNEGTFIYTQDRRKLYLVQL